MLSDTLHSGFVLIVAMSLLVKGNLDCFKIQLYLGMQAIHMCGS